MLTEARLFEPVEAEYNGSSGAAPELGERSGLPFDIDVEITVRAGVRRRATTGLSAVI